MSDYRLIFDAVCNYAETRADQAAVIFDKRITTYGELELRANRVATACLLSDCKHRVVWLF